MILTLGYRGVFRQEQYETVTIEGSVTFDTDKDGDYIDLDTRATMQHKLDLLVKPLIERAADISRYDENETVVYEWEGLIQDGTSEQAPQRHQARRIRRRD